MDDRTQDEPVLDASVVDDHVNENLLGREVWSGELEVVVRRVVRSDDLNLARRVERDVALGLLLVTGDDASLELDEDVARRLTRDE